MSNVVNGFNYHSTKGIQHRKKGWKDEQVFDENEQFYSIIYKYNADLDLAGGSYNKLTFDQAVKLYKQMIKLSTEVRLNRIGIGAMLISKNGRTVYNPDNVKF
jgi:hypothetical protein